MQDDLKKSASEIVDTSPETSTDEINAEHVQDPARKPRHGDKTAAREEKQKRLEAQLRNNLRRRKSQSRARQD